MLNCNPKQHLYLKHELEQIVHDDLNTEKEETHSLSYSAFVHALWPTFSSRSRTLVLFKPTRRRDAGCQVKYFYKQKPDRKLLNYAVNLRAQLIPFSELECTGNNRKQKL